MKYLVLLTVLFISACSNEPKPDGFCALNTHGICVLKYKNGEPVPSGEIDVRFNKLGGSGNIMDKTNTYVNGQEFGGTVTAKGKEWK